MRFLRCTRSKHVFSLVIFTHSFFFFSLSCLKQHYAVSKGLKLKPSFPGKEHLKSKDTKKEKVIEINEMQNYLFFATLVKFGICN